MLYDDDVSATSQNDWNDNDQKKEPSGKKQGCFVSILRCCVRLRYVLLISAVLSLLLWVCLFLFIGPFSKAYVLSYTSIKTKNSPLYKLWQKPVNGGVVMQRRFQFNNVSNFLGATNGSQPPILMETGPYVYDEIIEKNDTSVTWYDDGTVGYTYTSILLFNEELSIDELSGEQLYETDLLVFPNVAFITLMYRVARVPRINLESEFLSFCNQSIDVNLLRVAFGLDLTGKTLIQVIPIILELIDGFTKDKLSGFNLFVRHPLRDFVFGYYDPLFNCITTMVADSAYIATTIAQTQFNNSAVAPSSYTFRSGQKCPVWANKSDCELSNNSETRELSGIGPTNLTYLDNTMIPGSWLPVRGWLKGRQNKTLSWRMSYDPHDHSRFTQWTGQKSAWWLGPSIDGLTAGTDLIPGHVSTTINYEKDADCRLFPGGDGMRFKPDVDHDTILGMFLDIVAQSIYLEYNSVIHHDGIRAYRFSPMRSRWVDVNSWTRRCLNMRFQGFPNISQVGFAPVLLSNGAWHDTCFYEAAMKNPEPPYICTDPSYTGTEILSDHGFTSQNITMDVRFITELGGETYNYAQYAKKRWGGLTTKEFNDSHKSYVDVEPITGASVAGSAKSFITVFTGNVSTFGGMEPTAIPLLLFERYAKLEGEFKHTLKSKLTLLKVAHIILWVFLALNILFLIFAIFCVIFGAMGAGL